MNKRTLCFSNPAYLSTRHRQLVVAYPEKEKAERTVPIEDIGVVVLENRQITISNALIEKLSQEKVAVIFCDSRHMPSGLLLPFEGHTQQSSVWEAQLSATLPLKRQLWRQTVQAKIRNQAKFLKELGEKHKKLTNWANEVKSGDSGNLEASAASYYFPRVFQEEEEGFVRDRDAEGINALLNYGYAILRAIIARSLASSGLLLTRGIFHKGKYNAFCLADDIMEPYRPFVDMLVHDWWEHYPDELELTPLVKQHLLKLPQIDVKIGRRWTKPLLLAASSTSASLVECFMGAKKKIVYPSYG